MSLTMQVEYDLRFAMVTGLALLATTLLAAFYPAMRASRVPPADILSGL